MSAPQQEHRSGRSKTGHVLTSCIHRSAVACGRRGRRGSVPGRNRRTGQRRYRRQSPRRLVPIDGDREGVCSEDDCRQRLRWLAIISPSPRGGQLEGRRINAPVAVTFLLVVEAVMTPRLLVMSSRSVAFRLACCCRTVSGTGPIVCDALLQRLELEAPKVRLLAPPSLYAL